MHGVSRALLTAATLLLTVVAARSGLIAEGPREPSAVAARQDLPDGAGKEVVERLCVGCHDLMFTLSSREDEDGWTRVVNDMRSRGTDGTEEEFAQVIEYLTAHMGLAGPATPHATLELLASRTKVAPGEHFALGLRLIAAEGWRVKGRAPQVSWTMPQAMSVGDPVLAAADTLAVFQAAVGTSVEAGTTIDVTARVTYEVCQDTCVTETSTVSMSLPVGEGGASSHEATFARPH